MVHGGVVQSDLQCVAKGAVHGVARGVVQGAVRGVAYTELQLTLMASCNAFSIVYVNPVAVFICC